MDLGAAKLMALLDLLGMDRAAQPRAPRTHALILLSQTASVSYKQALPPGDLADALAAGDLGARTAVAKSGLGLRRRLA